LFILVLFLGKYLFAGKETFNNDGQRRLVFAALDNLTSLVHNASKWEISKVENKGKFWFL